ncbi:MAG: hypothetical protein ACOYVK_20890 [Bacillota bacterium]
MLHKLFYKSRYQHNISIIYFRDENLNDKESLVILPMDQNLNEEWSINIETSGELIYKFISDSMYIINDPHAESYIEIEGQGIWSKVKESQSRMKKKMPNVRNIYICKDIDDNYNPIESTNIIKPVDNLMICHTEIISISEDFLISMFWKDESGIVLLPLII